MTKEIEIDEAKKGKIYNMTAIGCTCPNAVGAYKYFEFIRKGGTRVIPILMEIDYKPIYFTDLSNG